MSTLTRFLSRTAVALAASAAITPAMAAPETFESFTVGAFSYASPWTGSGATIVDVGGPWDHVLNLNNGDTVFYNFNVPTLSTVSFEWDEYQTGAGTTGLYFGLPHTFIDSVTGNLGDNHYSVLLGSLAAGNYYIQLSHLGAGDYKLDNFEATITAVPEPESYAMLLAGLGALGFMARRRKAV